MNVLWPLFRYKSYFCAIEMMIMQNLTIFFLSFIVAFIPVSLRAQLHEAGVPVALNYNLSSTETTILNIDTVSITRNSTSGEVLLPEQAGVTISLMSRSNLIHGIWAKTDAGRFVWRASFEVPTAKSVNVYLDDLFLNHGDKLFVYSPDMKQVLGAFTQKNNRKHFSTGLIDGPGLVIEYSTGQKGKLPFKVAEIGAVMVNGERGFGGAGPCEVSVNCDEGFEWQSQKRGVARVLVKIPGKLFWCTGSLVNNTKKDGKPYFLTANHCGSGASADDYSTWVFDFDFESPNCELPDKEPAKLTFTGAKLIANGNTLRTSASDFKLLLLNRRVPDDYHLKAADLIEKTDYTYSNENNILEMIEKQDKTELKRMHIHMSGIEFNKGGEKRHLTLKGSKFKYREVLKVLKDFNVKGVVISESPIDEEDALLLKKEFENI